MDAHHLREGEVEEIIGIRLNLLQLVGIGEHPVPQVAYGLVGGLRPADEQKAGKGLDLLLAHPLAVDFSRDESRDEVVPGVLASRVDQRIDAIMKACVSAASCLEIVRAGHAGDHQRIPPVEVLMGLLGQIQHVHDDAQREPGGEIVHDVDFSRCRGRSRQTACMLDREFLDQGLCIALDRREKPRQALAHEDGRGQVSVCLVLPAVHLDHGPPAADSADAIGLSRTRVSLAVVKRGGDIFIPGYDPLVRSREIVGRVVVAKQLECRVGVLGELRGPEDRGVERRHCFLRLFSSHRLATRGAPWGQPGDRVCVQADAG